VFKVILACRRIGDAKTFEVQKAFFFGMRFFSDADLDDILDAIFALSALFPAGQIMVEQVGEASLVGVVVMMGVWGEVGLVGARFRSPTFGRLGRPPFVPPSPSNHTSFLWRQETDLVHEVRASHGTTWV